MPTVTVRRPESTGLWPRPGIGVGREGGNKPCRQEKITAKRTGKNTSLSKSQKLRVEREAEASSDEDANNKPKGGQEENHRMKRG